jgi:uncharacterized protein YggE
MIRSYRVCASLFALAVTAAAPSTGLTQEKESKGGRFITATGSATVRFRADRAQIHVGIRTSDVVFEAARDTCGKGTKAIEEAIAALKIRDLTITSAPLNIAQIDPNGRFGGGGFRVGGMGQPDGKSFSVTSSLTVVIQETNPDKLREAIDKVSKVAVDAGANTSGGAPIDPDYGFYPGRTGDNGPRVVLQRGDESEYRDKAFAEAVKKAMRTARAIADGAGVKIIDTTSIGEADDTDSSGGYNPFGSGTTRTGTVREVSGELELTVRVRVKCAY